MILLYLSNLIDFLVHRPWKETDIKQIIWKERSVLLQHSDSKHPRKQQQQWVQLEVKLSVIFCTFPKKY